MMLADRDIAAEVALGRLGIEPYTPAHLQPCSYDVTLGPRLWLPFERTDQGQPHTVVPTVSDLAYCGREINMDTDGAYRLDPGMVCLGSTREYFRVPAHLALKLDGRSSGGRAFLLIHATAGLCDAGWEGQITYEMANIGPFGLILRPGLRLGQVEVHRLSSPVETPYGDARRTSGGRYQGQTGPTPAYAHFGPWAEPPDVA